ncbi:MAG: sel1 repeat family protein, partial [Acholeplasmataceae bacterium]|nr:sel1 repeat family protein [Acholeplasmataceae bacterium]
MKAIEHYQRGLSNYLLNTPKKNIMVAIDHFNQAANLGYADAYYFLGRFYGLGDGISLDAVKAIEHYEKGEAFGSAKCGYAMGLAYQTGSGVDKNEDAAGVLFKKNFDVLMLEADSLDPVSMFIIGTHYYYGFHVKKFILKAIEWFVKAANLGYSDAQYMLGMIYETINHGDANQIEQSKHYYELAAKQEHPNALYALGLRYLEDEAWSNAVFHLERAAKQQYTLAAYTLGMYYHEKEPKYPHKAYEWFLSAAKQEHKESEYYVGLYHQLGKTGSPNLEQAIYWYEKAAKQQDKNALYHLAMILIKQDPKDFQSIFRLLERSALQNHPHAQYNLAVMYQKGDGVPRDHQKAFYWYEKAAELKLAIAQYNLGMLYFQGSVVEKNEEKAKYWWKKAAEQGLEEAVKLMYSINN